MYLPPKAYETCIKVNLSSEKFASVRKYLFSQPLDNVWVKPFLVNIQIFAESPLNLVLNTLALFSRERFILRPRQSQLSKCWCAQSAIPLRRQGLIPEVQKGEEGSLPKRQLRLFQLLFRTDVAANIKQGQLSRRPRGLRELRRQIRQQGLYSVMSWDLTLSCTKCCALYPLWPQFYLQ